MSAIQVFQLRSNKYNCKLDAAHQQQVKGGYGGYSFNFNFSNVSTDLQQERLNVSGGSLATNGSNVITTNNYYSEIPQPTNSPAS